jgi:hypothetical protein
MAAVYAPKFSVLVDPRNGFSGYFICSMPADISGKVGSKSNFLSHRLGDWPGLCAPAPVTPPRSLWPIIELLLAIAAAAADRSARVDSRFVATSPLVRLLGGDCRAFLPCAAIDREGEGEHSAFEPGMTP